MIQYRKSIGQDVWHWCFNCSNWPTELGTYNVHIGKPVSGYLCEKCKSMADVGACATRPV